MKEHNAMKRIAHRVSGCVNAFHFLPLRAKGLEDMPDSNAIEPERQCIGYRADVFPKSHHRIFFLAHALARTLLFALIGATVTLDPPWSRLALTSKVIFS